MNSIMVALIYAVVAIILVPFGFAIFKTQYQFLDVVLAALGGAACTLIPTAGSIASAAATLGILYWRMKRDFFPDIFVSVFVARLAVVPILLLMRK